ncbi:MAG: hypothetical protein PHE36_05020 [Novosphingobium sp.]|nr:hypothetical protein [Novosphingobium sp.]
MPEKRCRRGLTRDRLQRLAAQITDELKGTQSPRAAEFIVWLTGLLERAEQGHALAAWKPCSRQSTYSEWTMPAFGERKIGLGFGRWILVVSPEKGIEPIGYFGFAGLLWAFRR